MENPRLDFEIEHLENLKNAFNDGYAKGKADAEAYAMYCGDTDEPYTNADRIRQMTDEELADIITLINFNKLHSKDKWLDWLKEEVEE